MIAGEYSSMVDFPFLYEALGIRTKDQSCHHEVWLHLDFVDKHL